MMIAIPHTYLYIYSCMVISMCMHWLSNPFIFMYLCRYPSICLYNVCMYISCVFIYDVNIYVSMLTLTCMHAFINY